MRTKTAPKVIDWLAPHPGTPILDKDTRKELFQRHRMCCQSLTVPECDATLERWKANGFPMHILGQYICSMTGRMEVIVCDNPYDYHPEN